MPQPLLTSYDLRIADAALTSLVGREYRRRNEWNHNRPFRPAIPGMAATSRNAIRAEITTLRKIRALSNTL
jgi:hypothetical protein